MTETPQETVFVVTGDTLGRGSDELGRQLMNKFVSQIASQSPHPHAVAFYNAGVRLLAAGSSCLEALHALEQDGTELIACGTCVDYFQLRDTLTLGRITDMREIVAVMHASAKVVTV